MRTLVAVVLAIFTLPPANAGGTAVKKTPPGTYLPLCEASLTVGEGYEKLFVQSLKGPESLTRVLYDYGVIFSKSSHEAFLLALNEQVKVAIPKSLEDVPLEYSNVQDMKNLIFGINEIAKNPSRLQDLREAFLHALKELKAGEGEDAAGSIHHLALTRLLGAFQAEPEKEQTFNQFIDEYLKQHLLATLDYSVEHYKERWINFSQDAQRAKRIAAYAFPVVIAGLYNFAVFDPSGWGCLYFVRTTGECLYYGSGKQIFSHFLSIPVTGVASVLGLGILDLHKVAGQLYEKRTLRTLPKGKSELKTYVITQESGETLNLKAEKIFEAYNQLGNYLVTLEEACKQDICALTPLQVAYMGHIDILEVQRLQEQVREVFREKSIAEQVATLQKMAGDVLATPNDYRKQITLRREIEIFAKELESVGNVRTTLTDDLHRKVQGLKAAIATLRSKPYAVEAAKMSDGDITKFQILIEKMKTEFSAIENFPTDKQKFQDRVERIQRMRERLSAFLGDMPTTGEKWKELAENLILELDRMGK